MSRFRTHLAAAAIAAFAATATTALVSGNAVADQGWGRGRGENAQLRADLAYFEAANLELTRGLDRIEAEAQRSGDGRTRINVQRIVDNTRQRAGRFIGEERLEGGPVTRPLPAPVSLPMLSNSDFNRLVARVKDTMNPNDAVEVVRTASRAAYFNVDQTITLVKACSFESSRVEMAVVLYPRVVDLNRWFLVDEAFDFPSSRQQLRDRVKNVQSQVPQGAIAP